MLLEQTLKIDIGCGRNKKVGFTGVDNDPATQPDIVASALNLPFAESSVDEVYSAHLGEHFSPVELTQFFAEIYRVLKTNGQAILKVDTDWTVKKLLAKDPTHKHRYSVEEIKKILSGFGFSQGLVKKRIYFSRPWFKNKIFVTLIK